MEWSVYLVIALGVFCMHIIFGWGSSDKKQEEHTEPPQLDLSQMDEELESLQVEQETYDTMFQILRDIGYNPVGEEDGIISVTFQGELFKIYFNERYATMLHMPWSLVCTKAKELPTLCRVINNVNLCGSPTIVYGRPDENNLLGLSTMAVLFLHPDAPANKEYVKQTFEAFFDIKDDFRDELLKQFGLQTPELLDPHSEEHSCHIQEIRHQMPS